jgi:hypothetical protein
MGEICKIWNKEEAYLKRKEQINRLTHKRRPNENTDVYMADVSFPQKRLKVQAESPKATLNDYCVRNKKPMPIYTVVSLSFKRATFILISEFKWKRPV